MLVRVGLTGGIACGKSSVSRLFEALGVPVLDADQIARELVRPETPAWREILRYFGEEILDAEGNLQRNLLRSRILEDDPARHELEAILHPRVYRRLEREVAGLEGGAGYCILSVPLLVETGGLERVDRVLVVDCAEETQRRRLAQRDGLTAGHIEKLLAIQCRRDTRLAHAHEIIHNDGSLEELPKQVEEFHWFYSQLAKSGLPDKVES